jgi:hypothetical protein
MRHKRQKMVLGEKQQPTEKPVLVDAIGTTLRTIEDRAKLYRNLVVAVSMVSLASVMLASFSRQWPAFSGLIFIVPLTGGFLFLDSHMVLQWRAGILQMARLRSLDLAMFAKTISGFRQIPPDSLKAMLATLPTGSELTQQRVPRDETDVVIDKLEVLERKNAWRILYSTGLLTLALLSLIAGASYGSVTLLLLGGSLFTLGIRYR